MSIDLRVKHDLESRRRAVELFDAGVGCKPAAEALSVPRETVREWQWVYRAFGSEALLSMGGKQSRYTFEQRVTLTRAAAEAVRALRAEGHSLRHLLECSGLGRSTYYYALAHPRRPTRPC